jgi:hypothetical protein
LTIRQKNLQAFYDQLADDDITRDELDGRRKLCTLCETCWTSRADSLYTFRVSFPVVVHALEQLQTLPKTQSEIDTDKPISKNTKTLDPLLYYINSVAANIKKITQIFHLWRKA